MATLTKITVSRTAQALAPATGAVADKFANEGRTILYVKNGTVGSITLSITLARQVDGVTPAAKTYVLAANDEKVIGPFPVLDYNDASDFVNLSATDVGLSIKPLLVNQA